MPSANKRVPIVVVLGPTAIGKTEVAIKLAERLKGEIVSADSRLLYRGMDIGTAKPTLEQRTLVPHHLVDVANPDEVWSLAKFQQAAHTAITDIHERGKLPILVGGTGQYLRAILEGWSPPKLPPQPKLRGELERWVEAMGGEEPHKLLAMLDPIAAQNIDARNVRRTVRALEVIFATGARFSEQRTKSLSPYCVLQIGLIRPRPELYARIDARIEQMLQDGWLMEVKALLGKGYDPELPSLSAIGYRQLIDHLLGKISLGEAVTQIQRASRLFVRRQANWFKPDDPHINWFEAGNPDVIEKVLFVVKKFQEEN